MRVGCRVGCRRGVRGIGYHGRMRELRRTHIAALAARDLIDAMRNRTVLMSFAACTALAFVFRSIADGGARFAPGEAPAFLMTFVLACVPAFVGCVITLYVMAEEHERGMYLTLAEAGVALSSVAVAKVLASLACTLGGEALMCAVLGFSAAETGAFLVLSTVAVLPILLAGAALGLVASEQMASSVFSVPLVLVSVLPILTFVSRGIRGVAWVLPMGSAAELVRVAWGMAPIAPVPVLGALMVVWVVAGAALVAAARRRAQRNLDAELNRR